MTFLRYRLRFVFLGLLLAAVSAWACSVPVFRYGLEHWAADPYQAAVFHRGPLSDASLALMKKLRGDDKSEVPRANITVRDIDLAQSPPQEAVDLWKRAGSPDAPWLVVLPPRTMDVANTMFAAPLDDANVNAVIDSPVRREIIKRLGEGESAVWVLLEGGDKSQDDAAAKLISERLEYLGGVMELPKLDEQDIKNGLVSVPPEGLRLAFSMLRVSRADAAEKFFIHTLLTSEHDLKSFKGPMAFPVFGQARVLYALVDAGIKRENIDKAANFLIGSCSCQVKEQNPGADLLVAVDWKKLLKDQAIGAQDLPKVSDIIGTAPETVTIKPSEPAAKNADKDCCAIMSWAKANRGLAASACVLVVLIVAFLIARLFRRKASS